MTGEIKIAVEKVKKLACTNFFILSPFLGGVA